MTPPAKPPRRGRTHAKPPRRGRTHATPECPSPTVPAEPEKVAYRNYKFPLAIGDCADLAYTLRQARAEANKVAKRIDAECKALQEYIIETLPKSNTSGVAGDFARVQVVTKKVPRVEDWGKFYSYVESAGAFDLLQRRVNEAAIKERWENDETIPGVETFTAVNLSITKL